MIGPRFIVRNKRECVVYLCFERYVRWKNKDQVSSILSPFYVIDLSIHLCNVSLEIKPMNNSLVEH